MGRLLFRRGRVIFGKSSEEMDVLVEGEKITAVGKNLEADGAAVVDISGKYLFPGFIDSHTHMGLDVSDTVTIDGFDSGTREEFSGRNHVYCGFCHPEPGESL
jgi:dihydropyrimidinase